MTYTIIIPTCGSQELLEISVPYFAANLVREGTLSYPELLDMSCDFYNAGLWELSSLLLATTVAGRGIGGDYYRALAISRIESLVNADVELEEIFWDHNFRGGRFDVADLRRIVLFLAEGREDGGW